LGGRFGFGYGAVITIGVLSHAFYVHERLFGVLGERGYPTLVLAFCLGFDLDSDQSGCSGSKLSGLPTAICKKPKFNTDPLSVSRGHLPYIHNFG